METKPQIRAMAAPWHRGVNLLITETSPTGKRAVCKYIPMETVDDGCVIDPSLTISRDEAQVLIDDLWNAGFRPTEGAGSAGSLRATEKHLNDMRKIAFQGLGINENKEVK